MFTRGHFVGAIIEFNVILILNPTTEVKLMQRKSDLINSNILAFKRFSGR